MLAFFLPNFYPTESKEWGLLTVKEPEAVGLVDYFPGMLGVFQDSHPDHDKPLALYFVDVAVTDVMKRSSSPDDRFFCACIVHFFISLLTNLLPPQQGRQSVLGQPP
ncbi:hypothetical protein ACTL6P_23385 [Endozoicomonas acroporae]|uniref:hypothetical protein n=1 Tax=Endozoicomonas acroporae TaxID=1701104 RepID=UPI000C771B2E|nr:hypothetical protein [Endozoicomonas acroporae]